MSLKIQIITLIISILFGLIFSIILDIFKIFKSKKIFYIIISIFITILLSLIYFYVLLKINNAIIHPYYIIAFILGFILEFGLHKLFKIIVLKYKKWYNLIGG